MSKALIKNTGQILNIENEYGVFYKKVEIELNDREFSEATNVTAAIEITVTPPVVAGKIEAGKQLVIKYYGPYEKKARISEIEELKKEGRWFLLSDGKKYHKSDLVVGQEEIREYQLKQFNNNFKTFS